MKNLPILIIVVITVSAYGQKRFPEYTLKNDRLLKTIQLFTDSINLVYKKTGIIVIKFEKSEVETVYKQTELQPGVLSIDIKSGKDKIDLTFEIYSTAKGFSDSRPPTGYFFLNERPYLIYTGLEALTNPPSKSAIRHLKRKLKKFTDYGSRGGPVWGINLTNDKLEILYRFPGFNVKIGESGSR
jgi:hypothetical protein